MVGPSPLEEHLRQRIRTRGPLTFAEFMSDALYHPEWGYYRPTRSVVGTAGDFYTSVSATPMFARLLISVMEHYSSHFPVDVRESVRHVVHEFGAHRGQLRADMMAAAPALDYRSYEHGDEWPEHFDGCVVANELLDALPFHRVQVVDGRWRELYVGLDGEGFGWVAAELSNVELLEPLAGLPLQYMDGYTTEVSLEARRWIETLGARLQRGLVFLFDYGHETETYFSPNRAEGGLRTFKRHERGADPLIDVGERDITCDVNFSDVLSVAERAGFEVLEFLDQGRFFSRRVAALLRQQAPRAAPAEATRSEPDVFSGAGLVFTPEEVRGLMTLTHPAHLGAAFKVVVLRKW